MELYEREFFLSEILFGSKIIEINEDTTIYVRPLTIEQNAYAQRVFKKAYDEALLSGVLTRKEMLELMKEQEIWSEEDESLLKDNTKKIEDLKVRIYENFLRPTKKEGFRQELRQMEKEQLAILEKQHAHDHLDCQGIATYARLNWVIENTTTYKDGTPYSFDELDITGILKRREKNTLEIADYRELARTDPWRTIWSNSNQDAEKIFKKSTFELSEGQSSLLGWTRLYDNVSEAHESPSDKVVEDDDALDGWLISQRREREKEQSKQKLEGVVDKHGGANEIFIMTEGKEEAKEVDDLNDLEGKHVRKSRLKRLEKAVEDGTGGVRYQDFADVKMRIMNEASQKFGK